MLCSTGLRSYDADPAQPLVNSVNRSMRRGVGGDGGDASAGRRREEKKEGRRGGTSQADTISVYSQYCK